jgi:hypothetical protein
LSLNRKKGKAYAATTLENPLKTGLDRR